MTCAPWMFKASGKRVSSWVVSAGPIADLRFWAFLPLLLALHFYPKDRRGSWPAILTAQAIGLISLVKFSFAVPAALIMAAIGLDEIFIRRRPPWILVAYLAAVLGFWVLAGQRLEALV